MTNDWRTRAAATKKKDNPNYFKEMGRTGAQSRKVIKGGFADPEFARQAAYKSHAKRYAKIRQNKTTPRGS